MSNPASPSLIPCAARAHWTIYLPSLVVAAVWGGVYFWAASRAPELQGIKALALAVEALCVPVLLFFAAVRARALIVEVRVGGDLYVRSGFLRVAELHVGAREIASVRVRRSWAQYVFGGGALDIKTLSGERVIVQDLNRPDQIATALVVPKSGNVVPPNILH